MQWIECLRNQTNRAVTRETIVRGGGTGRKLRRERRVSVYEEAPGFRLGPRIVTRAQARGDGL